MFVPCYQYQISQSKVIPSFCLFQNRKVQSSKSMYCRTLCVKNIINVIVKSDSNALNTLFLLHVSEHTGLSIYVMGSPDFSAFIVLQEVQIQTNHFDPIIILFTLRIFLFQSPKVIQFQNISMQFGRYVTEAFIKSSHVFF